MCVCVYGWFVIIIDVVCDGVGREGDVGIGLGRMVKENGEEPLDFILYHGTRRDFLEVLERERRGREGGGGKGGEGERETERERERKGERKRERERENSER